MAEFNNIPNESISAFFDAVLSLETKEDCEKFFEDICTINELISIAQRLEVAKLLNEGLTFSVIAEKTGASTATIARVNKCIRYGAGGYSLVLGEKEDQEEN
ncbi:MAG: helix-turn-helix domain-containing protein [Clostridia bacterium]|nr:helix-turn-helix domain-containing protein [Clostridia bacterium]